MADNTLSLSDDDEATSIVIDNGSTTIKAGYAGDDEPKAVFSSTSSINDAMYPIKYGYIQDWNKMEKLWRYTFEHKLKISSKDYRVLLTQPPLNPRLSKEKTTIIMFETFNVPKFYLIIDAVLAQYASGRNTGVVVDSGGGITHIVPVYSGYCLPHAVMKSDISGNDLDEYLKLLLKNKTTTDATIKNIKEKFCHVNVSMNDKHYTLNELDYKLPDGNIIKIGSDIFRITECFFKPESFYGSNMLYNINDIAKEYLINGYSKQCYNKPLYGDITNLLWKYTEQSNMHFGIHQLVYKSIMKCDIDIRYILFSNIILSGGNTLFEGLQERLKKEITSLLSSPNFNTHRTVKVVASPERKYLSWIGGSILASLSTFEEMWIDKKEYDEQGPSIVHRKCSE